ncbi:MAG: thioredoxin family protein [Pseudomonadota bacterium]
MHPRIRNANMHGMNSRVAQFLCLLIFTPVALAAGDNDQRRFTGPQDVATILAHVDQARQEARDQGKLLMVVLGADWCHDSRAFIDFLEDPEFAALVDERYRVVTVNIGFYDNVRGVVSAWSLPIIYGTPTVIVEEPVSGVILNMNTLPSWRNAHALGVSVAVEYFDAFAPGLPPAKTKPSANLAQALASIDDFERSQAERIYAAYAILGDMIRELGDERPGADFNDKWDNLAFMRGRITRDLAALREAARSLDAAGERDIQLEFPHYDLFIDP